MKHLHQITNALQSQTEAVSGIEALARISCLQPTEAGVVHPKIRVQSRSQITKYRLSKRQAE